LWMVVRLIVLRPVVMTLLLAVAVPPLPRKTVFSSRGSSWTSSSSSSFFSIVSSFRLDFCCIRSCRRSCFKARVSLRASLVLAVLLFVISVDCLAKLVIQSSASILVVLLGLLLLLLPPFCFLLCCLLVAEEAERLAFFSGRLRFFPPGMIQYDSVLYLEFFSIRWNESIACSTSSYSIVQV